MRKKLVAGNWKMNGSLVSNEALLGVIRNAMPSSCDAAVLCPAVYLPQVQAALGDSVWFYGVQDISCHAQGAYTGEVSVSMARDFGATMTLVGHSERRAYHGESSELVAKKTVAALAGGLTPIVCIGETLQQREQGLTFDTIAAQLDPVVEAASAFVKNQQWPLILAYEPVWAIGTGQTASPEQAQEVHVFIRDRLATCLGATVSSTVKILYGGSVKASNARALFAQSDIDGALVGAAALQAQEFIGILNATLG